MLGAAEHAAGLKRGRQRCSHAASLLRVQHIFDAYTALVDLLVLRLSLWVEPHPELCAVGNQRLGYIDEGFFDGGFDPAIKR